jgi:GTPase
MIYGNIEGIRDTILSRLENIYDTKVWKDSLISKEVLDTISTISSDINREISIGIDRRGNIVSIALGDSSTVEMPVMDIREKKLSGVRIVHTHPNGNSRLSALDVSALIKMKLDCMAAVGVLNGNITDVTIGFCDSMNGVLTAQNTAPLNIEEVLGFDILKKIIFCEQNIKDSDVEEDESERAILVGVESEESIGELEELARACNVGVVNKVIQKKNRIDSAFYVGSGKVGEIAMLCQEDNANMIIFDDELTASQVRNIEETTGTKVIDRTTLILEIFARRARSRESKIQVELAQLKYRLPRLSGLGSVLSRTGGGIGTRGPGEKKLEIDRRHIKERIYDLNRELEKVRSVRETQRGRRSELPRVSLVGYTNAGKSTLRNKLSEIALPKESTEKEKVFEADMLFATLDTTTRAIMLADNRLITLTDTVGFIRKLPHDLVEAFKSTLEEVADSDLLLHVVDASASNIIEQVEAVDSVLRELAITNKPLLLVLNKIDRTDSSVIEDLLERYKDSSTICISAKQNINLDILLEKISDALPNKLREVKYLIPYTNQQTTAFIHRNAKVLNEDYADQGTIITALVEDEVYNKCLKYLIN